MVFFELKKMCKRRRFLVLYAFAGILLFYVRVLGSRIPSTEYSPINPSQGDPYLQLSMKIHNERNNEILGMKMENELLTPEMFEDWKQIEAEKNLLDELKKEFPKPSHRYYAYPDRLDEYEEKSLVFWKHFEAFVRKYEISMGKEWDGELRWILFESEYARSNGVHTRFKQQGNYITNYGREFLGNTKFFFGFPMICFFIFLFIDLFSGERTSGTLDFLRTQPIRRWRLIFGKIGALLVAAGSYFLFVCASLWVVCKVSGIPTDGLGEVYRVLDGGAEISYLTGWHVLGRTVAAYLCTMTFVSAWMIFESTRSSGSTASWMKVILALGALWVLTENVPFLQQAWNPIYLWDYLRTLIGKYELQTMKDGLTDYFLIPAVGPVPYFGYAAISVIFYIFAFLPKRERASRVQREKFQVPVSGAGVSELRKIRSNRGFSLGVVGGALLLSLIFLFMVLNDRFFVQSEMGAEGIIRFKRENYEENEKKLQYVLSPEGKFQVYAEHIHPYFSNTPPGDESTWIQEEIGSYRKVVGMYQILRDESLEQYKNQQELIQVYQSGNGTSFYRLRKEQAKDDVKQTSSSLLKQGQFMDATYRETMRVLGEASRLNARPMVNVDVQVSAREQYHDEKSRSLIESYYVPKSHSAFFFPYRLFRYGKGDWYFLIAMCLLVFGGYVFDKESGNQLEFLYTEPIGRRKLHWMKVGIAVLLSTGLLAVLYLFVFLLGGFTEGIGAWNFPIVYYTRGDFKVIGLWRYLLRVFLVIVAECFFLSSLSTFLSIFVKEKNRLLGGLALVVGGGVFLSNYLPQGILRLLSPFHYLQASTVANGAVKIFRNLPQESFWGSVLILVAWGVVFSILGSQVVKKRECV